MSLMVSISGVRGIVGTSLNPGTVVRFVSAFSGLCGPGPIVIGRDGRSTGAILANIASSTLIASGRDVVALGISATPTIGLAVDELEAAGGISVTASHNPMEWNGMKFIGRTGTFLDAAENDRLQEIVVRNSPAWAAWDKLGRHRREDDWAGRHIDAVLNHRWIDAGKIRKRRFKIVADCINAAGGLVVPQLLRRLGCDLVELNCDASGVFTRPPEPLPENLGELRSLVVSSGADLGIAVDPDVDRLVLVDERGEPFGEEYTIATAVKFALSREKHPDARIVVNLSTTRAIDDIAAEYGATVHRTPVGEINVVGKMRQCGAVIGGEGSGGVIVPEIHHMRDAVAGIVIVLQQLEEHGGTASSFRNTLPGYQIRKAAVRIRDGEPDAVLAGVRKSHASGAVITDMDGLKLDFERSWVHLRKSNTEPILRIIAEAPTAAEADELISRFSHIRV